MKTPGILATSLALVVLLIGARQDLPNVLIIGDSISIGYMGPLVEMMEDEARVVHNPGNAQHSGFGLEHLDEWLGDTDWDVIHFNHGLHDLKYVDDEGRNTRSRDSGHVQIPLDVYARNLEAIVARLTQTDARLIFATTTPYPDSVSGPLRLPNWPAAYNAVAIPIMERHGVAVNDLHALALPRLSSIQQPNDVHFTAEGSRVLAEEVVRQLRVVLGMANAVGTVQTGDDTYRFENPRPSWPADAGPTVCFDEAHHNFHTAGGRYAPFSRLIRGDGFVVRPSTSVFSDGVLEDCSVLVVANALAPDNAEEWQVPHAPAFGQEEIRSLVTWVRDGGRLLLIADHAPFPGAAADLGAAMGVLMQDVYAWPHGRAGFDRFTRTDGSLVDHEILDGASPEFRVDSVMTFGGHAFQTTPDWRPLIRFGRDAVVWFQAQQMFDLGGSAGTIEAAGHLQAAARTWGDGRVVVLGEAAMCSAQVTGDGQFRFGMNSPDAPQNARFCLNVVRWLAHGR